MREPKNEESEGLGGASKGGLPSRGSFSSFSAQNVTVDEIVSAYKQACQKLNCKQIPKLLKQIQVWAPPGPAPRPEFCGIASKPPCSHPTKGSRPAAERLIRRGSLISSSFLINSLAQRFGPGMFLELKRARACRGSGAEPGFAPRAPRPASNLSPQAQSVKI